MPTAAELLVKINADTSNAEGGIKRVDSQVKGLASSLGTAFGTAAGFLGAQVIGQLVGNFGQAIGGALDFGKEMANVNSIMQLSDAQLAQYGQQLLDLAGNPGITQMPAELAAGLYNIASSGFTGADAMKVLDVSARAATAGLTSTETSGRAVTSVLNAYGLQASDAQMVSDLLFQTVQDGVISFDQLANNMGNVLPVASSLGIALTDVFSAYSQLTLQGILPSAAETDIAGLMKTALNPTQALTAAVEAQGFANAQTAISTLGLSGYVQLLEKDAAATGKTLFEYLGTQEAVNAALAIGGKNIADYNAEQERMKHASEGVGATQAALEKQMKSASFQIAKARQEAMILATTLVNYVSPTIAKFAGGAAKGIASFTHWLDKALVGQMRWYKAMGRTNVQALFSALGITLEGITGIDVDGWFKRMGNAMQRPLDAAGKLFDALSVGNWRKAGAAIGDFISAGPKLLGDALKGINTRFDTLNRLLHTVGGTFTDVGRLVQEIGQGDFGGFVDVLDRFIGHLGSIGTQVLDATISIAAKWGGIVWGAATDAASWIKDNAGDIAATGIDATLSFLAKWGKMAWGAMADAGSWIKDNIVDPVVDGIPATLSFLASIGVIAYDGASDLASAIWNKVTAAGDILVPKVKAIIDGDLSLSDAFSSLLGNIGGWIQSHLGGGGGGGGFVPGTFGRQGSTAGIGGHEVVFSNWSLKIATPDGGVTIDLAGIGSAIWSFLTDKTLLDVSPTTVENFNTKGEEWGKELGDKLVKGIQNFFTGGGGGGGIDQPDWTDAVDALVKGLFTGFTDAVGAAIGLKVDEIVTGIKTKVDGWKTSITDAIKGIFDFGSGGDGGFVPGTFGRQGSTAGIGGGNDITSAITDLIGGGVDAAITWLTGKVGGWKDSITSAVKGVIPDSITLPTPDFNLDGIKGAVDDAIAKITGWIDDLKDIWNKLKFWQSDANGTPPLGVNFGFNNGTPGGGGGQPWIMGPDGQKSAPADNGAVAGIVKIDADTTLADGKINTLSDKVTTFTASPYTGILDFDNGPAAVKYTDTFNWGTVFDAATFTSTFDIDNGPAAVAYTDAFGWGNTWASQVFTASFSVDTSGITNAVAVARQAAADIAAVMPHSPAKEGPLKEPITFDYIADNMRGVADRLRGYAASGAGYVRDSFTDGPAWSPATAAGRSGGGDTYIVITPDSEQFSEIARKARQGDLNWKTLSAIRQRMM